MTASSCTEKPQKKKLLLVVKNEIGLDASQWTTCSYFIHRLTSGLVACSYSCVVKNLIVHFECDRQFDPSPSKLCFHFPGSFYELFPRWIREMNLERKSVVRCARFAINQNLCDLCRSYLTPVRDEEAEAQRKARSRHARQSRRSTQVRTSPLRTFKSFALLLTSLHHCMSSQGGDANGPAGGGEDDEDGQQREGQEGGGGEEGGQTEEGRGGGERCVSQPLAPVSCA